jgi:hypothetical protein
MLMDPDVRRVDEDVFEIGIIGQGLENPLPDALLRPAPEARVDGEPFAEFLRQIAPGCAGARNPQYRFDKQAIVTRGRAGITNLARQLWRNQGNRFRLTGWSDGSKFRGSRD